MTHIELFAGCGGMSLGLEAAGFELLFANELSPMASETFAYNLLNEDLEKLSQSKEASEKVLWINSKFKKGNLEDRLRENPFDKKRKKYHDIDDNTDLNKKLLVGDINDLLSYLEQNPGKAEELERANIDLLSGGPPCQGFSLAGLRIKDDSKNSLPLSFARFASIVRPKVVLLENVKGITAAFKEEGKKYYAWLEVSKAFALEGFVPVCMMINSKFFAVPQNRPRFILIAYRDDVFDSIVARFRGNNILETSARFYEQVNRNRENPESITKKDFTFYDIEGGDADLFDGVVLPKPLTNHGTFVPVSEAIKDLRKPNQARAFTASRVPYRDTLNAIFASQNPRPADFTLKNHEPRGHKFEVQSRFRLYQVINEFQNGQRKNATDFINGKEISKEASEKLFDELSNHLLYFRDQKGKGVFRYPDSMQEVVKLREEIGATKKHSQRALKEDEPAPAQLTIPDDVCHYSMDSLRTMTVREMARFQSFPDWFEFRSKVTTGGDMRKFEVPQYTQVGNAVPPLLAKALGEMIKQILNTI